MNKSGYNNVLLYSPSLPECLGNSNAICSSVGQYALQWVDMPSSGSICPSVVDMPSSGSICPPVGRYALQWVDMLFSGSISPNNLAEPTYNDHLGTLMDVRKSQKCSNIQNHFTSCQLEFGRQHLVKVAGKQLICVTAQ